MRAPFQIIWMQYIHLHGVSSPWSGLCICTMALPTIGPSAIPATLVKPNSDIGRLRALSPLHTSLILPPTTFIDTEEALPPKNLVTTRLQNFWQMLREIGKSRRLYTQQINLASFPYSLSMGQKRAETAQHPRSSSPQPNIYLEKVRFERGSEKPHTHFRSHKSPQEDR